VAPLVQAADLRGELCELCEGAAFLGVGAVQRGCVGQLARVATACGTAEAVHERFGGLSGADVLERTLSAVERAAAVHAAFRSDCLAEGSATAAVMSLRRAFAAVLVDASGLIEDLVEEVCLAMDSGIDHVSDELAMRTACAAGGREVVLEGEITLSGDETELDRLW